MHMLFPYKQYLMITKSVWGEIIKDFQEKKFAINEIAKA